MRYIVRVTMSDGEQFDGPVVHPDGPQGPKIENLQQAREIAKNMKWLDVSQYESVLLSNVKKIKVTEVK